MLFNIDNDLCVSKHTAPNSNKWICYSACLSTDNKKRTTWKNVTGLLSTDGMYRWLLENHSANHAAEHFSDLSLHSDH